jgi:hypothetical protein
MTQTDHIKWTTELFIEEASKVHSGKYDYSETVYTKIAEPAAIICPEHGVFLQKPVKHLRGQGCPKCGKDKGKRSSLSQNEFEKRSRQTHGDKYSYGKYTGWSIPMEVVCPEHGLFMQSPGSHISGRGCPECGKRTMGQRKWTAEKFELKARGIHSNKYSYDTSGFMTLKSFVTIICPEHGSFRQMAKMHVSSRSPQVCPKCGRLVCDDKRRNCIEDLIKLADNIHEGRYDYSKVSYKTMLDPVEIICRTHGSFFKRMCDHIYEGSGRPDCSRFRSKGEIEAAEWVESLGFVVDPNNRSILHGSELDIYIPEKKIAVEYNGLYRHSTANEKYRLNKDIHLNKLLICQDAGIRLIQIYDYEWKNRQTACKDIIAFALGKVEKRIFARKCNIREISVKDSNIFLEKYHIQGKCQAHYRIGLFFENELAGVQCYINNSSGKWTIARTVFISGCQIIGGISKMFNFFVKKNSPDTVIDYTDRRLFVASGHCQMGFKQECETRPTNSLTDGKRLYSRRHYRHWGDRHFKRRMPWDEALSDTENLADNGWYWVWDCGKIKNVWKRPV